MDGKGIKQNLKKAFELYKFACDDGSLLGCKNLGGMYEFGIGVSSNEDAAILAYKKSCIGDDERGCESLHKLCFNSRSPLCD